MFKVQSKTKVVQLQITQVTKSKLMLGTVQKLWNICPVNGEFSAPKKVFGLYPRFRRKVRGLLTTAGLHEGISEKT